MHRGTDPESPRLLREENLPRSEEFLRTFLEHAPAAIAMFDRDMRYIAASRRWITDYGISDQDIIGKSHYEVFPEIGDEWKQIHQRVLHTGISEAREEDSFPRADETLDWVKWELVPWRCPSGEIGGLIMFTEVITERKRAEEQQARLAAIVEATSDYASIATPDGQVVYINKAGRELAGIGPDEDISGLHARDLHPGEIADLLFSVAVPTALRESSWRGETILLSRDGREIPVSQVVLPHFAPTGEVDFLATIMRDITDQKRFENALRCSEELLYNTLDSLSAHIAVVDREGNIIAVNEAWRRFARENGDPSLEHTGVGINYLDVCRRAKGKYSDLAKQALDGLLAVLDGGISEFELEYPCPSNTENRWFSMRATPLARKEGGFVASHISITELKETEQALRESEGMFRALAESAPAAIGIIQGSRFVYANPYLSKYSGYTNEELLNMDVGQLVHPDHREMVMDRARRRQLGEDVPSPYEFKSVAKNGEVVWFDFAPTRIMYKGRPAIVGVAYDITERKYTEEALRNSEERLADIIDFLPDATFAIDCEGRVTTWNRAMEEMTGVKAQDILGKGDYEYTVAFYGERRPMLIDLVIHPDARVEKRYTSLKREGNTLVGDAFSLTLRPGGGYVWGKAAPLYDSAGKVIGAIESVRDTTERVMAERRRRDMEAHMRDFYRRTIMAATDGKLIITERGEICQIAGSPLKSWTITAGEDLGIIRSDAEEIAREFGMDPARTYDLMLTIGESTTNAFKHAHTAEASIHKLDGSLFFVVSDQGKGIEALTLPEVALVRGYSTAKSMGMGYKAMISIADRVYLATGPSGTTVGIEMKLHPERKPSLLEALADTW